MSKNLDSQLPRPSFGKMKLEGLSLMPQVFDDFSFSQHSEAPNKVSVPKVRTH
jgi:hypothetical protein